MKLTIVTLGSLPKLNTASVDDFLYIKKQGALARLVPGSVALQDEKDPLLKSKPKAVEAPKSKAVEVLKPTQEEPKKMSRKERQMVCMQFRKRKKRMIS